MKCSGCGHENRDAAKFCEECAAPLGRKCAGCGAELRPVAKFCDECAFPVTGAPPPARRPSLLYAEAPRREDPHLAERPRGRAQAGDRPLRRREGVDGSRRADRSRRVAPDLERFFQILTDGVHRFEGTVNQYTGDGIMALFGAPIAHEDHAQRACYAALSLQEDLHRYANELRVEKRDQLPVRVVARKVWQPSSAHHRCAAATTASTACSRASTSVSTTMS